MKRILTGRKRTVHIRCAMERDIPHMGRTTDTLLWRGLLCGRSKRVGRRAVLAEPPRWNAAELSCPRCIFVRRHSRYLIQQNPSR